MSWLAHSGDTDSEDSCDQSPGPGRHTDRGIGMAGPVSISVLRLWHKPDLSVLISALCVPAGMGTVVRKHGDEPQGADSRC